MPESSNIIKEKILGNMECSIFPGFTCDKSRNEKMISKLRKKNDLQMEKEIGERIKTSIPHFHYYFAPILTTCPVNIGELDPRSIEHCEMLNNTTSKNDSHSTYELCNMRYVGNKTIHDFLQDQPASERIQMIFECHLHLLKSIKYLKTLDIIHNDIKSSNILYDITNGLPIIIDFKWASKQTDIIFHKSPGQCTIEEFILSKIPIPANESQIFKEEELDNLLEEYISANQVDESYKTVLKEWLYIYREKSHKDFYLENIQYAEFWDIYSIGQIMQTFVNPIKEYNTFLYDILHALPNTRIKVEDCLTRLDEIYKSVHYSDLLDIDSIGQNAIFQPVIQEPQEEPEAEEEFREEPQPRLELQNEQDIEHHIKEYNKLTKDEIVPTRIPST